MRALVLQIILLCTVFTLHYNLVQTANLPSSRETCSPKYLKVAADALSVNKSSDVDVDVDYLGYEISEISESASGICPATCSNDANCVSVEKTDVCLCKNQVNGEGEIEIETEIQLPVTTFCTPDVHPNGKCAKICSQSQVKAPLNHPYNCRAQLDDDQSTTIEYCTCAAPRAHTISCTDSFYTATLNDSSLDVTPELCAGTCSSGSSCIATRSESGSWDLNGNCLCDDKPVGGAYALGPIEIIAAEDEDLNLDFENGSESNNKVEKYFGKIECKPEPEESASRNGKICQNCQALDSIQTAPFRCDILGHKTAGLKDKDAKILRTFCTCANLNPNSKSPSKGKGTAATQKPLQPKPNPKPPKGKGNGNGNTKPKGEKEKPGNNKNNQNNNNNNNKGKDKPKPKGTGTGTGAGQQKKGSNVSN